MRRNREQFLDPIRRGTTPTLKLDYPYDPSIIKEGYITFEQRGEIVFEKKFHDDSVEVHVGHILVDLSREETLQLTTVDLCRIQMLFDFKYEKAAASGIYKVPVLELLKGGETR